MVNISLVRPTFSRLINFWSILKTRSLFPAFFPANLWSLIWVSQRKAKGSIHATLHINSLGQNPLQWGGCISTVPIFTAQTDCSAGYILTGYPRLDANGTAHKNNPGPCLQHGSMSNRNWSYGCYKEISERNPWELIAGSWPMPKSK